MAWLDRIRRLAKDFEALIETATAWLMLAHVKGQVGEMIIILWAIVSDTQTFSFLAKNNGKVMATPAGRWRPAGNSGRAAGSQ